MARLPYLDEADLPDEHKPLLKRPINVVRVLVNSPGMAGAFGIMGNYIRFGSKLDPRLRQLAILQVGWSARSAYEWSHHVKIGFDFGVSEDDVSAIAAESRGEATDLDPPARLVLKAAREVLLGDGVTGETYNALAALFDAEQLVDLVGAIAFYVATVKILATFDVDVEPEYQPYLDRFPLPPS